MAIPTSYETRDELTGLTPREAAHKKAAEYREIINKLSTSMPADIGKAAPWLDPHFQAMIVGALHRAKEFERDAQHLAIIKGVFSGK